MLGVDRLDMIKGIPQKLLAFEKFLYGAAGGGLLGGFAKRGCWLPFARALGRRFLLTWVTSPPSLSDCRAPRVAGQGAAGAGERARAWDCPLDPRAGARACIPAALFSPSQHEPLRPTPLSHLPPSPASLPTPSHLVHPPKDRRPLPHRRARVPAPALHRPRDRGPHQRRVRDAHLRPHPPPRPPAVVPRAVRAVRRDG
jgi:hypothetical protein